MITFTITEFSVTVLSTFKDWFESNGYAGKAEVHNDVLLLTIPYSFDKNQLLCDFFDDQESNKESVLRVLMVQKLRLFTPNPVGFYIWLDDNHICLRNMAASDIQELAEEFMSL